MDDRSRALSRRIWPRQAVIMAILAGVLFASAGTLSFWQGWLYLGVTVGCMIASGVYFIRHDPALVERRMRGGPRAEKTPEQKIIITLMMIEFLLLIEVPALDYRWNGPTVAPWLVLVAEVGIVVSSAIIFFVMKENSYAAATVRVESEQPVVSTGPYAVVRHPMYAGVLLLTVCMPLALASARSLLLLVLVLPTLAWRLIDEERVLKRDLPGYADYCQRVRYRLVPGVW
jgi:protein-S-isoprenylcysteine O-methyltransferase Ste14